MSSASSGRATLDPWHLSLGLLDSLGLLLGALSHTVKYYNLKLDCLISLVINCNRVSGPSNSLRGPPLPIMDLIHVVSLIVGILIPLVNYMYM